MQLRNVLSAALLALCCVDNVAGRVAPQARQDTLSTTAASTGEQSTTATTTSSTSNTQTSQTSTSTTSQDQAKNDQTKTKADLTSSTSTTSHATPTHTGQHNATSVDNEDRLPIQPTITPALGIAGVVLMLTGVVFAIGGIKHQWLVVFGSAAYLAALAVSVLIIYVMNPPVSDGIQGAFMVAALLTGVIFGGISLVFKEVTEGLGCLLGGFCLSMWFLVLKPGGLIQSTTGRAIMIGVFSAVGWSLAFSQYTRSYGLIFCTAFAGAMICILGIDCFSRAGLKEFWLYIWNLNPDIFPIHTKTYPISRGIRVEIAGTVVLFLFGVMSQIKIWKIVKERKERSAAARQAEAERRDQRDSAIGKKIEKTNHRSLTQWEAVYGDKHRLHDHTDSGVGTSLAEDGKKSASVNTREIEMDDMGGMVAESSSSGQRGPVMIRTGSDDGSQDLERGPRELELNLLDPDERLWWQDFNSTKAKSNHRTVRSVDDTSLNEMQPQNRPAVPGGPDVVPLPFWPSAEHHAGEVEGESSPVKKNKSVQQERGVTLNKLALEKLDQHAPANLPRIDDDRASSVAATANDDFDADDRSIKRKSLAPTIQVQDEGLSPFSDKFKEDVPRSPSFRTRRTSGTPTENPVDENDDEILVRPAPLELEPPAMEQKPNSSNKQQRRVSTGSRRRSTGSASSKKVDDESASQSEDAASVHSLKGHLPESISKIAMAFRTNEWAKHIADADQPVYEPMPDTGADEAGVQVEVGRPVEEPRALDLEALADSGPPPDAGVSINPSFRQSKSAQQLRRQSSGPTPIYSFGRAASQQSLQRQGSSNSVNQQRRELRNFSAPISQQPLLESPIEEDQPLASPYSDLQSPPLSNANLYDERNSRLERRMTSTSFNALSSKPNLRLMTPTPEPGAHPSGSITAASITSEPLQEENLTLAERKALMSQGVISPTSPTQPHSSRPRQSSNPTPTLGRVNSTANQNLIYDSHQPRRAGTVDTIKQNAMLTQWRQSLQQDGIPKTDAFAEQEGRRTMMSQREQAGHRRQKEVEKRRTRESLRDVAMRTGQLTNAHQEAMRRMQAKANTGNES